jgi:beta-lactamase class A
MRQHLVKVLLLAATLWLALPALAQPLAQAAADKLDNDLRFLVGRYAKHGDFAVAVVDSNGVRAAINARSPYPLASVFKLPLLLSILSAQEAGHFPSMETTLTVGQSDQCIGSGSLVHRGLGAQVTVDEAARLMMSVSDNTATDLLFRKYGEEKLDGKLASWGFKSSQILLTNRQAWLLSLGQVPGWGKTTPEARVQKWKALSREQKLARAAEIERAAADLTLSGFQRLEDASLGSQSEAQDRLLAAQLDNKISALDLARMLAALDAGKLLSESGKQTALDIMAGQKYHTRLPARLSSGTTIYHKTGTLSGIVNDAGLIYVPGRESGIAVVFLSQNVTNEGAAESLAAQVAQAVEQAYGSPH